MGCLRHQWGDTSCIIEKSPSHAYLTGAGRKMHSLKGQMKREGSDEGQGDISCGGVRKGDGLDGGNDVQAGTIRRRRERKWYRFARAYVTSDLQQCTGSSSENRWGGEEK